MQLCDIYQVMIIAKASNNALSQNISKKFFNHREILKELTPIN